MKNLILFALSIILLACSNLNEEAHDEYNWQEHYQKSEIMIEMRDGVKLHTTIYSPTDTTKVYPVLLKRTPYSSKPYGLDTLPARIHHNHNMVKEGYIFVIQDVRGRWMSEGQFENTKPPYSLFDSTKTDELTDSWDTFEWFDKHLKNYNGSAGVYGTSYPGWHTLVAARCNHPSIKAVIATAPVTNFYFEDFNRNGLFALNYLPVVSLFGTPRPHPTDTAWYPNKSELYGLSGDEKPDYYEFFRERLALSNFSDIVDSNDFFWRNIKEHQTYDDYRKLRNWAQYYNDISANVMVVGGWNDEQNLYGILNSFKHIKENSPKANAQLVLGPWSHGHSTRGDSAYYLGDIFYGYNLSKDYMRDIELPYFEYHLKNKGEKPATNVKLFDTGKKEWRVFDKFPEPMESSTYYLANEKNLTKNNNIPSNNEYYSYISDPFNPVPFTSEEDFHMMAPKSYVTEDQRFASKRPDVLTFTTDILEEDLTILGTIKAYIDFSTTLEDADLFVKIIDVYPINRPVDSKDLKDVKMTGYQQLVRCGYIRGRYRNGFEEGVPFISNEKARVALELLDIFHTFKKDHKIMIQIQSSMFPLFDLNPQNYVDDIYAAKKSDFSIATHKIYRSSRIEFPIFKD
ncbi:CocE/NonD family hydrolase [Crocinitomix algicola]|uniref:CocE/NonD family hydrolase n=1 Tax=Crocinitomix algicola TaxID=1740263 RepID=UPI000871E734|nr:CocE/NonD family hydrolase [Crocinitomix algicola]